MASCIVSDAPFRHNSGSLLSVGEVADRYGVHPNTVRNHEDSGSLPCLRINGGHRRFSEDDVLSWLGLAGERGNGEDGTTSPAHVPLALVARVSSDKQARKSGANATASSLDHQVDRVEAFATERYGLDAVRNARRYYGTGSGLNFDRPEFCRLVSDILSGVLRGGVIIAYDKTRIARFAVRLVEQLCDIGGCKIVYIMDEKKGDGNEGEPEGLMESLTEDLLSIMTHFTATYSGMKAAKVTTIPVAPEDLQRIWELHCEGYGHKTITEILAGEGRVDPKNAKPYTRWVVEKAIKQNSEVLEQTVGRVPTRFESFATTHIVKDELATLEYFDIEAAYRRWEEEQGRIPVTNPVIKKGMLELGVAQRICKKGGRHRKLYVGVRLV